jgi:hypothetical protein
MFGHQDEPAQQPNAVNDQPAAAPADNGYAGDVVNPALPPAGTDFGLAAAQAPVTNTNNLLEPQATDGFTGSPAPQASPAPTVGAPGPLADLKQQALQQLSPLVDKLEQTPEEKFRTTMMLIQASDNQDLLKTAYEAANQISDEKARAQALLDVVNEINYFSQQNNS